MAKKGAMPAGARKEIDDLLKMLNDSIDYIEAFPPLPPGFERIAAMTAGVLGRMNAARVAISTAVEKIDADETDDDQPRIELLLAVMQANMAHAELKVFVNRMSAFADRMIACHEKVLGMEAGQASAAGVTLAPGIVMGPDGRIIKS